MMFSLCKSTLLLTTGSEAEPTTVRPFAFLLLFILTVSLPAQEKRRLPPPGIPVPEAERKELESGLKQLTQEILSLRQQEKYGSFIKRILPDVEIFHKAVDWALRHDEFFKKREFLEAKELLATGLERAKYLKQGKMPWAYKNGLIVRGYRSRIDDSVQPYGLVIPDSWSMISSREWRLDFWLHGRGNTLTELRFISDRLKKPGQFTPKDTIVLHPYGRFCNANKFAGEVDLFEALEHLKTFYAINENRILIRGFSMGGGATWHFATHHAGLFAAAQPGAGFAETAHYQNIFKDKVPPTAIEQKLWHLYDATDYAANLFNLPTVAYSGEIDKQIQAAQIMAEAMKKEGLNLTHLIGPKTGHKFHPETKIEIDKLIDQFALKRRDPVPDQLRFTTFTLRYNRMKWIEVDGLEEHWSRARIEAQRKDHQLEIKTSNVDRFSIQYPKKRIPFDRVPTLSIDGMKVPLTPEIITKETEVKVSFEKKSDQWRGVKEYSNSGLRKKHGLQGPIDDVFMDRFIIVKGSGAPLNAEVGSWVKKEQNQAIKLWRQFFRGDARVVLDKDLKASDIENSHLILWGDPSSNSVIQKVLSDLPIQWDKEKIHANGKTYSAKANIPVLIYPNPLNPERYVVLNSGYTFQENTHKSNSRHIPLLPDWAILKLKHPKTATMSQRVEAAGFFSEKWRW